jgi:hypothetical protein
MRRRWGSATNVPNPALEDALMAKLTLKQRANLAARDFGLPEKARSSANRSTRNCSVLDVEDLVEPGHLEHYCGRKAVDAGRGARRRA